MYLKIVQMMVFWMVMLLMLLLPDDVVGVPTEPLRLSFDAVTCPFDAFQLEQVNERKKRVSFWFLEVMQCE